MLTGRIVSGLDCSGYYRGFLVYTLGTNCEEILHLHCIPEQEIKEGIDEKKVIDRLGYEKEVTEFEGSYTLTLSGKKIGALHVDTPSNLTSKSDVQTLLRKSGYQFS